MSINEALTIFSKSKYSKFQKATKYAVHKGNVIILSKPVVPDYMACSCWIIKEDGSLVPSNVLWLDTDVIDFREIRKDNGD